MPRRWPCVKQIAVSGWALLGVKSAACALLLLYCLGTHPLILPHTPYPDLYELFFAYAVALAKRRDEGVLSEENTRLELVQLSSQIAAEEQRRNAITVSQQQAQQFNNLFASFVLNQALALQRRPITCTQTGAFIKCW